MRRTFAGLLLSTAIGCVQATEEIAITGVSKSVSEPRTVELVHPVVRASVSSWSALRTLTLDAAA